MADEHPIDHLYAAILARKGADPRRSYTAKLLKAGIAQCAKKLGEEGVEAALAGVGGRKKEIVSESADVLYHLLVLWAATGVNPKSVYDALDARRGRSGLSEKKARGRR
jgi:phosphoribosyl-ATP pyrophosphohydrolase